MQVKFYNHKRKNSNIKKGSFAKSFNTLKKYIFLLVAVTSLQYSFTSPQNIFSSKSSYFKLKTEILFAAILLVLQKFTKNVFTFNTKYRQVT